MAGLSEKARALLDEPNLAFLATLSADGSPQVTPVWIDYEDGAVLVNTAVGWAKDRNMRRDPRVAVSLASRDDIYRRLSIRGRVVGFVEGDEAERHLDKLSKKYTGNDPYQDRKAGERRVVFRIEPDRIHERL